MLFQEVCFRTATFEGHDYLWKVVKTCRKLKGFSYKDYFEAKPFGRARLTPLVVR